MERDTKKALYYKKLAYLYADKVCEYLVTNSYKNKNKDNSIAISRLIKAAHNSIDGIDLEKVEPEDVFKTIVKHKLVLDKSYPKNPEKKFVYDQEMDDFYVRVLSSYLDLLLPMSAPYDANLIEKVTELRTKAKAFYVSGVSAEALLESLTVTGVIDGNKCFTSLNEDKQNERSIRWDELTTKKSINFGNVTDKAYLELANKYLDTALPCLTTFYENVSDEELEDITATEVCLGKAYVLNQVLNNGVRGLGILEAAVGFKVFEEKEYLKKNNVSWSQGPEDLEVFYVGMLGKAISMYDGDVSKEEKQAYVNEMAELYSVGYSAEGLFESFAGQPLDDTKRMQGVKAGEMLLRRRSFECFKRAQ
mgnify:CR=1 FL=1